MNKLSTKERVQILHMLVEGNSLRAVARMAGVSRNTVDKLLRQAGDACLDYQDKTFQNLPCKLVECDEIWSFVYAKQKNVEDAENAPEVAGDVWTWVSICADTKLVPCWHVGGRDADAAYSFMADLAGRLANRVQLSTDGLNLYTDAVKRSFGGDVDYAMLIKKYGGANSDGKYSPAKCVGTEKVLKTGRPVKSKVSTSYVERQNLTMRMSMRRFTRLTNGFSKKVENHMAAISLHYMHYNFCRVHQTLKQTPAMAAGVADSVLGLDFIIELVDEANPLAKKRGSYKKRAANS